MATGSASAPELAALRAKVDTFPAAVTAALRARAWQTSRDVYARAKTALIAQQKTATRKLADAMHIVEEPDRKQFLVISQAPDGQPANVPIWLERGTKFMQARPYMRPAADAEEPRYIKAMQAAAEQVAEQELG